MVDFYVNLVYCDLAKLDYLRSLLVDSLGFSTETIMCISRECYFHLSSLLFAFCMPSVSFSCFIALARTPSTIKKKNLVRVDSLALFLNLGKKHLIIHH